MILIVICSCIFCGSNSCGFYSFPYQTVSTNIGFGIIMFVITFQRKRRYAKCKKQPVLCIFTPTRHSTVEEHRRFYHVTTTTSITKLNEERKKSAHMFGYGINNNKYYFRLDFFFSVTTKCSPKSRGGLVKIS